MSFAAQQLQKITQNQDLCHWLKAHKLQGIPEFLQSKNIQIIDSLGYLDQFSWFMKFGTVS